jgi:alpha-galactosidase
VSVSVLYYLPPLILSIFSVVITIGPPSETKGEVRGFSLIYSGNFLFEAEVEEMGRLRTNMGIHPMGLSWYLKPGGVFNTPEAVLVRSDEGLGGMSRVLHRLFLDKLIPRTWADDGPAPV